MFNTNFSGHNKIWEAQKTGLEGVIAGLSPIAGLLIGVSIILFLQTA